MQLHKFSVTVSIYVFFHLKCTFCSFEAPTNSRCVKPIRIQHLLPFIGTASGTSSQKWEFCIPIYVCITGRCGIHHANHVYFKYWIPRPPPQQIGCWFFVLSLSHILCLQVLITWKLKDKTTVIFHIIHDNPFLFIIWCCRNN